MADENAELQAWIQRQLELQARHLADKDLVEHKVRAALSWVMPMQLCIGRIVSAHNKSEAFWTISGAKIPTDAVEAKLAKTNRDAARHFALKWQVQAARLDGAPDGKMAPVGAELARSAEALYALTLNDSAWEMRG